MRRHSFPVIFGLTAAFWGAAVWARDAAPANEPAPAKEPAAAAPAGPAPRVVFDAVSVNLGDVVHGQDAVATFSYRNTGDAPLHILSAKPG